jgi:hypothetical protein
MTWRATIPPKKTGPRAARNTWLRLFNTFPDHPKWGLVAIEAGVTRELVIATVVKLLTIANKAHARGSVEDYSSEEWASTLESQARAAPREEAQRIFDVLHRQGWIDQGFLVTWYEHNPEQEDPTRAERVKRHREKRRAEKNTQALARLAALKPAPSAPAPPPTSTSSETAFQSTVTPFHPDKAGGIGTYDRSRNGVSAVSETPRSDQKLRELAKGSSDEAWYLPGRAREWLYGARDSRGEGLEVVMMRTGRSENFARFLIGECLKVLDSDHDQVAQIIIAAIGQDVQGAAFKELVDQHIGNARDRISGQPGLPLAVALSGGRRE